MVVARHDQIVVFWGHWSGQVCSEMDFRMPMENVSKGKDGLYSLNLLLSAFSPSHTYSCFA